MTINDHFFLFYFFPLFIAIYLVARKKLLISNLVVIFFSVIFYSSFGVENLPILIIPLIFDYFLGQQIFNTKSLKTKKMLLAIGVVLNLGLLLYYKYSIFAVKSILLLPIHNSYFTSFVGPTLIPIGISFITFQRISYLVDIYRKTIAPAKSFIQYATYDSFFPHLLSGPIVRFASISTELTKRVINYETIFEASKFIIIGFFFKTLIADQLYPVEELFSANMNSVHFFDSIIILIYFSLRIYFDFLGYSLMAIGLAKFIGLSFPQNFNSPYQSKSITEFWQRWNITLSNWLRDYLYIPLGGNRKGNLRTYINLFITMLLAGLWHGASWNFLIWGSLYGAYLAIERFFKFQSWTLPIPSLLKVALTFTLVTLTWSVFKFTTLENVYLLFKPLITFDFAPLSRMNLITFTESLPVLIAAILWAFFFREEWIGSVKPSYKYSIALTLTFIFVLGYSLIRRSIPFIYYQF